MSIGGSKRRDAVAFVIDGKGYVCTGISNGEYQDDIYMYDPSEGKWTQKRDIADNNDDENYDDDYNIVRSNAVAFVIDNRAYVGMGVTSSLRNDFWEYDPVADLWEEKTAYEGVARTDAVAFSIEGTRGFVTTGRSSSYEFDDILEFKPFDEYEEHD